MTDEELRARLGRLDPQAASPVDPITSPRAHHLLEHTMTASVTDAPTSPAATATSVRRRRLVLGLAAGVAAVGIGVGAGVLTTSTGNDRPAVPAAGPVLALSLPASEVGASCPVFDAANLKGFPVAFAGRVTAVDQDSVTLAVTRWYAGGQAASVRLSSPTGTGSAGTGSAGLDGTAFADGSDYLVSARDGAVSTCGYSGEAGDVLRQAYAQAFGGQP